MFGDNEAFWNSDPQLNVGSRHHVLPQFYMAGFSDSRNFIRQVDRDTGHARTQHIRKTLSEKDYFTVVTHDMEADGRLESFLSHLEGATAGVVRGLTHPLLRVWPVTPDLREILALFVAFQFVRGRKARRAFEMFADLAERAHWSGITRENAAQVLKGKGAEPTKENIEQLLAWADQMEGSEFIPSTNDHLEFMSKFPFEVASRLRARPMRLVRWDSPVLITSDEPVMLVNGPERLADHRMGLSTADEVWVPLSPQHLLIFDRPGSFAADNWSAGDAAMIAPFNESMAMNSFESYLSTPGVTFDGLDVPPGTRPVMSVSGLEGLVDTERYSGVDVRRRPRGFRAPATGATSNSDLEERLQERPDGAPLGDPVPNPARDGVHWAARYASGPDGNTAPVELPRR